MNLLLDYKLGLLVVNNLPTWWGVIFRIEKQREGEGGAFGEI